MPKTIVIEYDPIEGKHMPDSCMSTEMQSITESLNLIDEDGVLALKYANETMVMMTRLLVKRGLLNHENIIYRFNGIDMHIDRDARLDKWPKGFCDNFDNMLDEILD